MRLAPATVAHLRRANRALDAQALDADCLAAAAREPVAPAEVPAQLRYLTAGVVWRAEQVAWQHVLEARTRRALAAQRERAA